MADQRGAKQVVALALMASAAIFCIVALLIFLGTIPVGEEARLAAAAVVGVVGVMDFLIGLWFFRMGQSS
jgi:hypothetical protein